MTPQRMCEACFQNNQDLQTTEWIPDTMWIQEGPVISNYVLRLTSRFVFEFVFLFEIVLCLFEIVLCLFCLFHDVIMIFSVYYCLMKQVMNL